MSDPRPLALVTGGAKRVGHAIVRRLLKGGYAVAFTYHSTAAADLPTLFPGEDPGALCPIRADLTDPPAAVDHIRDGLVRFGGRLKVLVNNASVYQSGDLASTTLEHARRLMAIHYESPLLLAQAFAEQLRASRGRIINMADLLAERPWPDYVAYCCSKGALVTLTRALARALAPEVTVNAIAPGVVAWPDDYPQSEREKYLRRVPLDRAGTPEDVASLVEYLVSQATYVTGQVIHLDGGRSIT